MFMITGLRLTEIKSDGFTGQFSRYQLSKHKLTPLCNGGFYWAPGKITHHPRSAQEAETYFDIMGAAYDKTEHVFE